jgi:FMN phosphatase YigB (HAD superfamily)
VVIATQPVFPLVAIRQRMDWARVGDFPYQLITSYENMHSCKPMTEYYLEIASIIGCPPNECVMVGNDPAQDISPAQDAGMATYLVTTSGKDEAVGDNCGALTQLGERLAALRRGALD